MPPAPLSPAPRPKSLELARLQFIQREFAPFLSDGFGLAPGQRVERIYWIHDRLFVDGSSVESVRSELSGGDRRARVLAVTSGKGGVGKTTVSLNLAVAAAAMGARTLLVDADLGMANIHVFGGIKPTLTLLDYIDERASFADIVARGPGNLEVICGVSGVGRLADLEPRMLHRFGRGLLSIANRYDLVVIDTGAGIGPAVLACLELASEVLLIATPNLAATLDAYGVVKAAHEHGIRKPWSLLVNYALEAAEAEPVAARLQGCAQRFLQIDLASAGWLPRAVEIEEANQARVPLVLRTTGGAVAQKLSELAARFTPSRSITSNAA
jgi:flagellar biosynthesis protein FlhG